MVGSELIGHAHNGRLLNDNIGVAWCTARLRGGNMEMVILECPNHAPPGARDMARGQELGIKALGLLSGSRENVNRDQDVV